MIKKTCYIIIVILTCIPIFTYAENYDVVGTYVPPLMYQEGNQAKGFYVEILEEMVKIMDGIHISYSFYPAPRMFKMISHNSKTFSLGITRNEKRESLYKWAGPIYPRIFYLFKLKNRLDIRIKTLEDARNYKIGVGRGYAARNDLIKAGVSFDKIEEVATDIQNVKKLFANRVDLITGNDVMVAYILNQEGHHWKDVEPVLVLSDRYEFWYAFNKDFEQSVIDAFQRSLDKIKENGKHAEIVKKYFK